MKHRVEISVLKYLDRDGDWSICECPFVQGSMHSSFCGIWCPHFNLIEKLPIDGQGPSTPFSVHLTCGGVERIINLES